jgi:adenylate cyclase
MAARLVRGRPAAWWRAKRRRLLRFWALGAAVSVVVTLASALGVLEATQARTYDALLTLVGRHVASGVVIVAIDDEDFEALGQVQPLPRDYLAKILRGLQRAGASVVAFDVDFAAPTAHDAALAAAIAGFSEHGLGKVVLTLAQPPEGPLAPPAFTTRLLRGAPDVPIDADDVIRRAVLFVPEGNGGRPSLAAAVVGRVAGLDQAGLEDTLARGRIPGDAGARGLPVIRPGEGLRINFAGPTRTFLTLPGRTVAALAADGADPPTDNPIRGKVALVGAAFAASRDFFKTPHGEMPGVEIQANIVHMVLTRSFIRPAGWLLAFALQLAVVAGAGVVMVAVSGLLGTMLCLAVPVAVALPASLLAFSRGGYWIDFVLPLMATRGLTLLASFLEGRRVEREFGQYVSPEVARSVADEVASLEGERRMVSILFADVRNFAPLLEQLPSSAVARRLTEYYDAMSELTFAHRGMIHDFSGAGIMAVFGAPLEDGDHAAHAIRTAVGMSARLAALNARWKDAGLPTLTMGIAVHSGEVFAGNIGSKGRKKYALVGDNVTVASRVEGLNHDFGTAILITHATREALGDRVQVRDRGVVQVGDREEPVRVYEVIALTEEPAAMTQGRR